MKKLSFIKLGVNVDHVATLRQARGTCYPGIVQAAKVCAAAGAKGITVHLREDRRHIQDKDVYALKKALKVKLNLEMAIHPDIVDIALDVVPDEVCLVPEKRQELTTEGGLDVVKHFKQLEKICTRMENKGIEVSLFIAPVPAQIKAAAWLGVPYIELHTGTFCDATGSQADVELDRLVSGAILASEIGLRVNAGHGINMDNIGRVLTIPCLDTLNIGHSIVSRAIFIGLDGAVREMLAAMSLYKAGFRK